MLFVLIKINTIPNSINALLWYISSTPRQLCPNYNGVFPKWSRTSIELSYFSEFRESDKSLQRELGSISRSFSHMYLAGTVVALGSLTQEMACSSPFNDKYFLSLTSLKSWKTFRKNSNIAMTIQCTVLQLKQIGTLSLPDDFFLTFFESVFTNVGPTLPLGLYRDKNTANCCKVG